MKAAIIFSGCGQKDGTEVNEAILALLALDKRHIEWRGFAPDIDVNPICHLKNGRSSKEKRHVLEESARLARGNVEDLKNLDVHEFDFLCLPGGMGAATLLSDFSTQGFSGTVIADHKKAITQFHHLKKPIVAICISPAVVAIALKELPSLTITLGAQSEKDTPKHLHILPCYATECVIDKENKIISTPAFMADTKSRYEVSAGIDKAIESAVKML